MDIRRIEVRHASPRIQQRVRAWFDSPSAIGAVDGGRSVHLPHPEKRGVSLKIKGAGLRGGPIRFGTFSSTGPVAPRFDFDGRMMVDVASGHDNAFLGGASFQQAATEYRMAGVLQSLGIPAVPCIGYGRVDTDEHASWFSLHEWPRSCVEFSADEGDGYRDVNRRVSELMLKLAVEHGLVGYFWLAGRDDGADMAFDLHPFVRLEPVTASQLSWVMHLLYAYHVRCRACLHFPVAAGLKNLSPDIAAFPLLGVLPDAVHSDYEALRNLVIKPFLVPSLPDFSSRRLVEALMRTRIGRALLEICPERYARW